MPNEDRDKPSVANRTADQIRNERQSGDATPLDPERGAGPEGNATLRRVWDEPGGEAYNYRNSLVGAGGKADNHSDLTAAETPETTRHLSDATLAPNDKDATAEAIERATAPAARAPGGSGR